MEKKIFIIPCPDCRGKGKKLEIMRNIFVGTKEWETNEICLRCKGLGSLKVKEEDIEEQIRGLKDAN